MKGKKPSLPTFEWGDETPSDTGKPKRRLTLEEVDLELAELEAELQEGTREKAGETIENNDK